MATDVRGEQKGGRQVKQTEGRFVYELLAIQNRQLRTYIHLFRVSINMRFLWKNISPHVSFILLLLHHIKFYWLELSFPYIFSFKHLRFTGIYDSWLIQNCRVHAPYVPLRGYSISTYTVQGSGGWDMQTNEDMQRKGQGRFLHTYKPRGEGSPKSGQNAWKA